MAAVPFLTIVLSLLAALSLTGLVVALWRWRRADQAERALAVRAERAEQMLALSPDGLLVWHADGGEWCSRRMAVLLGLAAGTGSRYDDVRARFEGRAGATLDDAVQALRQDGDPFDLLLDLDDRRIQAVGVRASGADGGRLADLLWMRDASTASAAERPPDNREDGRLSMLLDALPMPLWLRDADLAVAYANRADRIHGIAELSEDVATRARAEGRPATGRRLVGGDGTARVMEITEIPLGADGGTIGLAIDRSDVEEMEGRLKHQAAARAQVLDTLPTAIALFGDDGRLEFANTAYAAMLGLEPSWLAANPSLGAVLDRLRALRRLPEVADVRTVRKEHLDRLGTLEEPIEDLLHLPDGTTLRCVIGPYGEGGLVYTYEDVSDRLHLARSFKTLSAVQRETLNNLHEGIAVFGSDGRLRLSNPAFARLWNLDGHEVETGLHVAEFVERTRSLLPDIADWDEHKQRVLSRLMGRTSSGGRIERGDGSILRYANVPLPDGAVLLSYLDVTDSARVEAALRQRAAALEEAGRLKSEFIANVSHEVRTPLNTIIGFAEVLEAGYFGELNRRQQDYGRGILESARGLMSVIGDILDLASVEAGVMTLETEPVDLHSVLAGVMNLIRERARRKELNLEFDCPPDIGWLVADETRLKQVVFKLLSNAVRFTPNRGGIRLTALRAGDDIVIAVADTGIGIPKADQEQVLRTLDATSGSGGAGLGLSLVKRFVELHGGRVEIKSTPNRGTTVTCRFPAQGPEGGPGAEHAFEL